MKPRLCHRTAPFAGGATPRRSLPTVLATPSLDLASAAANQHRRRVYLPFSLVCETAHVGWRSDESAPGCGVGPVTSLATRRQASPPSHRMAADRPTAVGKYAKTRST